MERLESFEIEKELLVEQVILRLYNCNPAVFIDYKLTTFITKLSDDIYNLSRDLYDLKNQIQQTKQEQAGWSESYLQTKYQFTCYKALVLLTALLLSLEQLLTNDFNPNLQQIRRNPNSTGLEKFNEITIEVASNRKVIEDSVFKMFKVWL